MKIVQTFWTAGKSLTSDSFGWNNPQTHLLSWTLSCLSLRKHHEEVVLYTDTEGCQTFIEKMHLPYTEVVVCYDHLKCPEAHWAYPKLLTYARQDAPFVHVDGDLYLPQGLPKEFEEASLIAQNAEGGTDYYKQMMRGILEKQPILPDYLYQELTKESIGAYNAGVLGGNDLAFITQYCDEAFRVIKDNHLDDLDCKMVNVNNNLMFEQTLFYALVHKYGKHVSTVFPKNMMDNGYTYEEFCNILQYDHTRLLHILGGHKRNRIVDKQLETILAAKYPEYYMRVLSLFPQRNKRLCPTSHLTRSDLTVQMCVAIYCDWLQAQIERWKDIPTARLLALARHADGYLHFIHANQTERELFSLTKNPYTAIFSMPHGWPEEAKTILCYRASPDTLPCQSDIACIPCLSGEGYKERLIGDMAYNILALLEEEMSIKDLCTQLSTCFSDEMASDKERIERLINRELNYLLDNGIIYAHLPQQVNL